MECTLFDTYLPPGRCAPPSWLDGRVFSQAPEAIVESRSANTSRTPSNQCLDGNFIHFGLQAYLSPMDGGEGISQLLQLRCIHAQLSRQCDLRTKCRMSTKMLQTTNRKSSTAMLRYKPNTIKESAYHDRNDWLPHGDYSFDTYLQPDACRGATT